ncbi:heme biosynthesis protein HemY [Wolbachia endosymbiont of Drosophila mauritiana]|uniref:tetratricopeptide repeat protein n=1 Tax=unclassified Wolbachia TaxID=2640676 RepID=UPI00107ECA1B|nr:MULTISPECIES: heme biosynthesis protein HemY [unclassified Wolbachia]QCB62279.1 heme biosynthesis protein HemY [Wolbachia endosymbiont of Drosophila mauritiana]QCB63326.1 heme biosynthesis protein HemY [Wolbachia endosymbiont of Drosophila mauritiana]QWE33416.1 Membrane-bound protoheme IX biogenesis protein, HemY [Wolbachia endosymbiont of Drosophila simulans]TGB06429.1 heme biosynthesis protein HemY [Wolbachia endosymbiont of Drosophila mauritiana]
MIYFIIFAFSFLFGMWIKVSGEVIKLELGNYAISVDLYFVILACVVLLFLLIAVARFCSSISSTFANIKNRRRSREELLLFEAFFSLDLGNIENTNKLIKNLNEEGDKLSLVKLFNAGKTGNYSFFSHSLMSIASKNRNLALLLVNKLIIHLKQERSVFRKFIEYCSSSINDRILSIPLQIENCVLQEDWVNAISRLKEAIKFNIFLPFDSKKMLAVFYCALAKQYESKGNFKEAIKSLLRAQGCCTAFQPINYLKAELYIKLGRIKKAFAVLEEEYAVNPTPQSARMYIKLNSKGAERLYNLRPDYYFSYCLLALSSISLGKYDLANQHLDIAMKKANYISIYLVMVQLKIMLQEYDQAIYWLNKMDSEAVPDPSWKCTGCNRELKQWDYKCSSCNNFDCIYNQAL